jgi:hypothetical protein
MNRAGFTTVEVIIASALIIALVTAGGAGLRQMNLLSQVATTRTASTEIRARVLSALSNSGACAANLGTPILPSPLSPLPVPRMPLNTISDGPVPLLESGKKALGDPTNAIQNDGVIYRMALAFPNPAFTYTFPAGLGRSSSTIRYDAFLEITTERATLKKMGGAQTDLYSRIPLSVEFDQISGRLLSCTVHPDDIDEFLLGGLHTVRQCLEADGFPIPTEMGLICRIPVPGQIQRAAGYAGAIPTCASLAPTWQNASPLNPNYNTTIPNFIEGRGCKGKVPGDTGWHSMGRYDVESKTIRIKRGTSDLLMVVLGGTAFVMIVVVSFVPVIGTIIAAAAALVGFVISLFKKCKKENFKFYAQVTSVGCV